MKDNYKERIQAFIDILNKKPVSDKEVIKIYEKYKNQLRDYENIVPNIFEELYGDYRAWLYRIDIGYYVLGDKDCLPKKSYKDIREIYTSFCGPDLSYENIYKKFYKPHESLIFV